MAKSTPKQQMLILGCAAIVICLVCLSFGAVVLHLYFQYDQHVVRMHPSEVNGLLRDLASGVLAMAAFLGYTAWVALRNRKHLPA
jgi:hypothetical protein